MILLAIDTAANLCAACVWDSVAGVELGRSVLDLGKGHAEHLIGAIDAALKAASLSYADLGAVAVSIGPGSFTGVRVGVSTARGLALALKIPAIGVTTLEAIAAETKSASPGHTTLVVLDAGREHIYAAVYQSFSMLRYGPVMIAFEDAVALARQGGPILAGTAAEKIAAAARSGNAVASLSATADVAIYARIAAERGPSADKPKPLYLRPPDAKPQASHVLPRRPG
jgi:tRNA threonylcarbamoyladenosine biosynthesis protein TsaB